MEHWFSESGACALPCRSRSFSLGLQLLKTESSYLQNLAQTTSQKTISTTDCVNIKCMFTQSLQLGFQECIAITIV